MKKTGFYIIRDKFFEDMPDPYLKGNKAGNRPHYYCFEDYVSVQGATRSKSLDLCPSVVTLAPCTPCTLTLAIMNDK